MNKKFRILKLILFVLVVPLGLFFFGMLVMYLWNFTLPALLHVSPISFWQATGILVLSKLLFGGFPGGWHKRPNQWKKNMEDKFSNMTPEEREKFKQEWKTRCSNIKWTADKPVRETKVSEPFPD